MLSAVSGWRVGCIVLSRWCSKRENDNDVNGSFRDCLAESETTSTPARRGAHQPGFRDRALSGPGIGFHLRRVVLDHYVELASSSRWRSRLVWPRRWCAVAFDLIRHIRTGPEPILSLSRIRLATAIAKILVDPTCLFRQSAKPELIDWPSGDAIPDWLRRWSQTHG